MRAADRERMRPLPPSKVQSLPAEAGREVPPVRPGDDLAHTTASSGPDHDDHEHNHHDDGPQCDDHHNPGEHDDHHCADHDDHHCAEHDDHHYADHLLHAVRRKL